MARCLPTTRFPPLPRRARNARRVPNLKRRGPNREPKRRFVLFCEGRNAEPKYFEAIERTCSGTLIDVKRGVGVPMTVAEKATEEAQTRRRRRGKRDSFEEGDQIWAVFDRDAHPRFEEAVRLCDQHGVEVARSDPCFELWLILHERDYDQPCDRREAQRELGGLRPEYDRDGAKMPDCADMVHRIEQAENRAEAQLRRREEEGAPYGNPSTTVFRLTRAIRGADERARPQTAG